MNKVLVIRNIHAGRKTVVRYKKLLRNFLRDNASIFKIIEIDECEGFDATEFDTIIAMGGDGTVNKALKFVNNTDKCLGILPCGTANLLAARLGIPFNIKKALKIIKNGYSKKIDSISINNQNFILRVGFGYDSDIICKTPQSLKNKFGYFSYFISGCIFAFRLKLKTYDLQFDDKSFSVDSSCLIISNASNMYRNWFSVADNSYIDDGFFDLFILKVKNPFLFIFEFIKIIFGNKYNSNKVQYLKLNKLKILNKWSVIHIDGEKFNLKEDIIFQINKHSVNVFVEK